MDREYDKESYNAGLSQAQWQITKAMMGLSYNRVMTQEIKNLLIFIYDEIDKEIKP